MSRNGNNLKMRMCESVSACGYAYVYMYTCVYKCMHVYSHTLTLTRTHIFRVFPFLCTHIHTRIHIFRVFPFLDLNTSDTSKKMELIYTQRNGILCV